MVYPSPHPHHQHNCLNRTSIHVCISHWCWHWDPNLMINMMMLMMRQVREGVEGRHTPGWVLQKDQATLHPDSLSSTGSLDEKQTWLGLVWRRWGWNGVGQPGWWWWCWGGCEGEGLQGWTGGAASVLCPRPTSSKLRRRSEQSRQLSEAEPPTVPHSTSPSSSSSQAKAPSGFQPPDTFDGSCPNIV